MGITRPEYRPDIDGLRAVAVLSVVAFHALPEHLKGGFVGVDIFFVISGYLISQIIIGNLRRGSFRVSEFYARRIRRIFPSLLVVLVATYATGWMTLPAEEFRQLGKHISGGAGFVSNLVLWQESGYFDALAETKPLLHLWSLGVEEQFYIAWPLILWFAWRRGVSLLLTIAVLGALSFGANLVVAARDPVACFYAPYTRFWELLVGGALASLEMRNQTLVAPAGRVSVLPAAWSTPASVLGGALLAFAIVWIDTGFSYPDAWALIPVAGAAALIAAGPKGLLNRTLLSSRLAIGFGLISYPLYLWHWPLLSFVTIIEGGMPGPGVRAVLVGLSVGLAWTVYRFVEQPVRHGGNGALKVGVLVVAMAMAGLAGYDALAREGLPFRDAAVVAERPAQLKWRPLFRNQICDAQFPQFARFSACLLSHQAPPEILVLGDSHANQYYRAFAANLPGKVVMNLGEWHCLPFAAPPLASRVTCGDKGLAALEFATKTPSIQVVYLAGYWSYLAAGGFEIVNEARKPVSLQPGNAGAFVEAGVLVVGSLQQAGKRVVFIEDMPDLDFPLRSCTATPRLFVEARNLRAKCGMDRASYERRNAEYAVVVDQLASRFPEMERYSPRELFCDNEFCTAVRGEINLYTDPDHLSLEGADMVVRDLLNKHPVP